MWLYVYVVYQLYWSYSNPQKKDTMITTLVGGLIKFYLFFDFGGGWGITSPTWIPIMAADPQPGAKTTPPTQYGSPTISPATEKPQSSRSLSRSFSWIWLRFNVIQ